ncbi:MAG: lipopolysaccharide kinase InaA family protein [Burkholderiales bacterium]
MPNGGTMRVILKRQQDHTKKTWRHPIRGVSTLRAEAQTISRLQSFGVPVPEVIYFGESPRASAALP